MPRLMHACASGDWEGWPDSLVRRPLQGLSAGGPAPVHHEPIWDDGVWELTHRLAGRRVSGRTPLGKETVCGAVGFMGSWGEPHL
jgi:hypothetical protein